MYMLLSIRCRRVIIDNQDHFVPPAAAAALGGAWGGGQATASLRGRISAYAEAWHGGEGRGGEERCGARDKDRTKMAQQRGRAAPRRGSGPGARASAGKAVEASAIIASWNACIATARPLVA